MKPCSLAICVLISFALGIAQTYLLMVVWGYLAVNSPLLEWVLGMGLRGASLRAVVYPIDFLTNVVLSLPAAFVIVRLRPAKPLLFLVAAVVPSFIWLNLHVLGTSELAQFWPSFMFGWVQQLFALPAAVFILSFIFGSGAPNNALQATCEDARA